MNWSSFTKKQQQMIIATAVLAVIQILALAYFLGWFRPASERGGSGKEELRDLQVKLDEARTILLRAEPINKELKQSVEKLEELTIYTPASSDRYAWAYEYISRCATLSGVEIERLEEGPVADKGKPAGPYEISVATRCGYNNLVELLGRLEKGNPLLRVKEVTSASVADNAERHQVRIVLQWPASVKIERGSP